MNVLVPIAITDAMILSATTPEPAASETAWVSAGTYAVDDLRIRSTTHKVYSCVQAHTGRTALPENDAAYWLAKGPTLRYAPFDWYSTTACVATATQTYVLQPGFFNALSFYGIVGAAITISVKDAPGGSVIYTYSGSLSEPPAGWYEYLFAPLRPIPKLIIKGVPIRPLAELTIVVTPLAGVVGIGMINIGDYRPFIGDALWGGAEYGASAEPTSYSYIKTYDDGTTEIKRRGKATNLRASVVLPQDATDYALSLLQEVLDVPVSIIATDVPGYAGLNTFGLLSGSAVYASPGHSTLSLTAKGMM